MGVGVGEGKADGVLGVCASDPPPPVQASRPLNNKIEMSIPDDPILG
jgi:hypothetical protein